MEATHMTFLKTFWHEEEGQDLIEYTLLLAFICLVGAAIFIPFGQSVSSTWSSGNLVASEAASAAAAAGS
jgi:Flp pilus assembly pilin Flp